MSINHRAGLCEGWKRGAAACSRMATPGFHTCTYHRHQEATVIALARSLFGTRPELPGQLDMFGGDAA